VSDPVWRTADELAVLFGVKPRTIRQWHYRGHTTRQGAKYDLAALSHWWDTHRNHRMAALRDRRSSIS
jgi:phage terminase Nu1 subunit (DNA packaging protein)